MRKSENQLLRDVLIVMQKLWKALERGLFYKFKMAIFHVNICTVESLQ